MKGFLIAGWLIGAVAFAVVSYDDRCKREDDWGGWRDVAVMSTGSLLWPAVLAARVGVAAFNPHYAVRGLGCPVTAH